MNTASLSLLCFGTALSGSLLQAQSGPSELWRLNGAVASERLASSMTQIADIDGDKFGDYLVGGPSNGFAGLKNPGSAKVISGRSGKLLRTHKGSKAYDYFGSVVARLGDLDADGVDEYAISAPRIFLGSEMGSVFVFSGKTGKLHMEIKADSTLAKSGFGSSLAAVGDVDGDKTPDILVGAPLAKQTISSRKLQVGVVLVFSGRTGKRIRLLAGTSALDRFGHAVCALDDLDKDGIPEILVAAPQSRSGKTGYVRIFAGKNGALLRTVVGSNSGDNFALSVARSPDLDGDGIADFVVGAPQTTGPPLGAGGYVRAFSSASGKVLWTRKGTQKSEGFGYALASIGDLDGDGRSDFAASTNISIFPNAPGQVRILSGKSGAILHSWGGKNKTSQFGKTVAAAGDRNADGRPDVLVGVPLDGIGGIIERGSIRVISAWPLSFRSDRPDISVLRGGKQVLDLDAGTLRASKIYIVLGSRAGLYPGLALPGGKTLPLNPDPYLGLLLAAPNSLIFPSVGILDSNGRAKASFSLPGRLNPSLIGLRFDHAYVVLGRTIPQIAWTSNPVSLKLTR